MIRSYLKLAFRNILKQKGTSIINVLGLAIGIACSILILLFVAYELSYDRYHEKGDRIYRLAVRASIGDTKIHQTHSSAITFLKLLDDFPEIESGIKFIKVDEIPVILEGETTYENNVFLSDSTFFDIFTVPLIYGTKEQVLNQPNTMVVTEETARRLFNRTDVIGEVLTVDFSSWFGPIDFTITGVSEEMPGPSHFHYNFLLSMVSFPSMINNTGWTANNFTTYLLLNEGASKEDVEARLPEFTRTYMGGESFDEWVSKGNYWEYFLQPLHDIHLNSDLNGEFESNGNKTYVYIFAVLGCIILLIACINFMNLSTAKSSLRSREVGLRKVIGSRRTRLVQQFLSESVVLSLISLALALIIVESLMPLYQNFVGRPIELHYFDNFIVIPSLIVLGLVVGLISGSYPAFVLSSFKPVTAIKGQSGSSRGGVWLRNILVIIQFSISIFLIVGTITVYRQMRYFQDKELGFKKEQVLVIKNPGVLGTQEAAFKKALLQNSSVVTVAGSNTLPGEGFSNWGFGAEGVEESFTLNACICDHQFLDALQIQLLQGRFFSPDYPSDSAAAVLNKEAVDLLGWEDPIGKKINNWAEQRGNFTVIGVIEDYHYESLHQEIRPMALFLVGGYYKQPQSYISVRFNPGHPAETIQFAETVWNSFVADKPFEYSFLDQDYESLYLNEKQTRKLFTIFSVLAIFIASLGLYGLASFVADQRTKEIGIRKVMGASVRRIVTRLNLNFTIWVLLANLIAWPAAWYFMNRWLQNFAYRVDLNIWAFLAAALMALFIAYAVISIQSIRAALQNPAESLRYE
jgi:putative ABC transport system permease protein